MAEVGQFSERDAKRIARIVPFVERMMLNPPSRVSRWQGHPDFILWAKAQSDWEENGTYPEGDPRVSVKRCQRDGTEERGDAFWVYLPRNPRPAGTIINYDHDADPYVFADFVIGYNYSVGGDAICLTPYLHMGKIKQIHILGNDADDGWIPVGFHECDGSSQTGEAGTFNLADFVRDYQPIGGEENVVGAFPRHKSEGDTTHTDEDVGEANCWAYLIDSIGSGSVVTVPTQGVCDDSDGDTQNVGIGEYPAEIVLFYQRYK